MIESSAEPHRQSQYTFRFEREIREHRPHHRLVHKMFPKHAAVTAMKNSPHQSSAHHASRRDHTIEPGELHHFQDGTNPLAFLANPQCKGVDEFDFGGSV